jgi:stage IV sporulation protein FB
MLGIPESTSYDLRFRLLGIPVRVHPFFWIVAAFLGFRERNIPLTLLNAGCVFLSIMVHEYGHGLMAKAFRFRPSIVLHGLGGLCFSEAERQTFRQRLAVLICGPGAGFALFALAIVAAWAIRGIPPRDSLALIGIGRGFPERVYFGLGGSINLTEAYGFLLLINLWWGVFNLAPIWPLDGGQITGVLLSMVNRREGMRWTHVISLVTAGVLAVVMYQWGETFMPIFFALFALTNFQILQAMHHSSISSGGLDEDEDWWKR